MSTSQSSASRTFWDVFLPPSLVALVSGAGLVSALIGDGVYDVIAWLTLSLPLAIVWRAMTSLFFRFRKAKWL